MPVNASRLALAVTAWLLSGCSQDVSDTDWPAYLGNSARTHYSELSQIDKGNVGSLKVAWVYDTGELAPGISTIYTSPLIVNGVLFGLSPTLNAFAVDAETGEELWRYPVDISGEIQPGLMWWHKENESRLFYTAGPYLLALDPETGQGSAGFGESGKLDLRDHWNGVELSVPSPGVVFEDLLILGLESATDANPGGTVMAISVYNGEVVWQFSGDKTTSGDETEERSAVNAAASLTLDTERGILFVPTGQPKPGFYGGKRRAANLYANSLLALDVRTGELRWHYQVTTHDTWNRELPSPPTLVQVAQSGRMIDAVALATRAGYLYLFNRETGELLNKTEELKGLPSTVPGNQAVVTRTVSAIRFIRQAFELTDRNESARRTVKTIIEDLDQRPFAPPSPGGALLFPSYDGGAGWGGSAFEPGSRKLILNTQETAGILRLLEIPAGFSDRDEYFKNCARCHGSDRKGLFAGRTDRYGAGGPSLIGIGERLSEKDIRSTIQNGRGSMPALSNLGEVERKAIARYLLSGPTNFQEDFRTNETTYVPASRTTIRDEENLPGNKPPWGSLIAIDLDTGAVDWQVPLGNYPSHPQLRFGAENAGGPLLTASGLIFIAATPDMKISAYDALDGTLLWQSDLDAAGYSTPVTFSTRGKQYVVVAAGGGLLGPPSGSQYIAFALPN